MLLTGTPEFIGRPLAARLMIDHLRGTVCHVNNGEFTAMPPLTHPYGAAKLELARSLCHRFSSDLDKAVAYGDAAADILLLSKVGRPVAVRPDRRLRSAALKGGWEVIE